MPKDYIGKRTGKILTPSDSGFNDPRLPWGGIRNIAGWRKPDAVHLPIAGFFLIDRRTRPPTAIFKNAVIEGGKRSTCGEEPLPFPSLDEALFFKARMHLSMGDEPKVKPVALVPDPGMGNPQPDTIWVDKKTAKNM